MRRKKNKQLKIQQALHARLKLSHHRHTGKRLEHRHTSWGLLVLIMVATTAIMGFTAKVALADDITLSGNISVNAKIPGPPPTDPAVIDSPLSGQDFTSSRITLSGTCPDGTIVQIYKNSIFAGAIDCADDKFTLEIDLLRGSNILIAKVIDSLDQYGPDSAPVTVTYTVPTLPDISSGSTSSSSVIEMQRKAYSQALNLPQMLITTEANYQGILKNKLLQLKLIISGGQTPYAVYIDWGDGQPELLSQANAGNFVASHTYKAIGRYKIKIKAADSLSSQSFVQTVVIVYGENTAPISAIKFIDDYADNLFFVWPMYLFVFIAVTFFWIGERYGLYKLKKPVHKLKP
jgi:hypothetical protein